MTNKPLGSHAIVIGGSMAGVLAARALSDYFTTVTVIERDVYSSDCEPRKGVPQARHAHGLLMRGFDVLSAFFPNLPERLADMGAIRGDMGTMMKMHYFGGFKVPTESGMLGTVSTRGLLDLALRQELGMVTNVRFLTNKSVEGLISNQSEGRVMGVTIREREGGATEELLSADLVVDTSGRGSQSPKWLELMGYERPAESTVKVNVGYATRLYKRSVADADAKVYLISTSAPGKRMGVAFPVEGQRWIVTLTGALGDYPPLDDEAALAFARTLPAQDIAEIMAHEEPITEAVQFRFPSNFRRHYETMPRFPDGYLVMGDAVCSFNPIYGQGMTTTAMEAETLHVLLGAKPATLDGFAARYFRAITKHVDFAWQMATGEDFRHAEVEGERPFGTAFLHHYIEWMHKATQIDPVVHVAFLRVMNMLETPPILMKPAILLRVLRHRFSGGNAARKRAVAPAPRYGQLTEV